MDDRVSQIDVSTLQERVYQELRNVLYQGRFVPGEPLTIRSLATALGTSPMPVREALQRLVAEKALVQMPNRNFRVAPLTAEIFDELTRIRIEIEGYAAQRAAARATPALADRLRRINEDFRRVVAADEPNAMLEVNQAFHFALYDAAEAPQLLEIIKSLWLRSGPFLALVRKVSGSIVMFERGVHIHDRLVAALERRDPAAARYAIALDIRAAAAWFRRNYQFDAAGERRAE
jgi:DNA-binding GntR family transcriptional regulator